MNLIDIAQDFGTEEQCTKYLVQMRWPDGVKCVLCGSARVCDFVRKSRSGKMKQLFQCLEPNCKEMFSATVGTIFEDTHLPLTKWFTAIAIMLNAKKGVSALQMQRDLGCAYKTAWYLCHRIRKAMEPNSGGLFTGTVEVDETYVGGRYDKRRKRAKYDKAPVIGMVERGGEVRATVPNGKINQRIALNSINENIAPNAEMVCTDESSLYHDVKNTHAHGAVNHSIKEYVKGSIHTQTIDGFWSLFKRRLIGQHHQVSVKHLHRYLNEAVYAYNGRTAPALFEQTVTGLVSKDVFRYAKLISPAVE